MAGDNSDAELDSEVQLSADELSVKVDELEDALVAQDRNLKLAVCKLREYKKKFENATIELELLKSAPTVVDEIECDACGVYMIQMSNLQTRHASIVDELEKTKLALEELKPRSFLLGACKNCLILKSELSENYAKLKDFEKKLVNASSSKAIISACDTCASLLNELHTCQAEILRLEDENKLHRSVLSWVSTSEPQLGMIVEQFKREDRAGVGRDYTRVPYEYGKIGECSTSGVSACEKSTVTNTQNQCVVIPVEPPKIPPKKQIWIPKPNEYQNRLATVPPITEKRKPK
jgi:hypothetical protein